MQKTRKAEKKTSDSQILRMYLKEISRIPLLNRREEEDLADKVRSGELSALRKLVESNLRFVVKIAKRYRGLGIPFPDLINEGNLGLIEAARRYDPSRNVRFISYAVWWIRQSIVLAVSSQAHPFRVPLRVNHSLYQLANMTEGGENTPPVEEVADRLGLTHKKVTALMLLSQPHVSLNQPIHAHADFMKQEDTLAAQRPDPDNRLIQNARRNILAEAFCLLGSREIQILQMRFGLNDENPLNLQQIGEKIGLSRERVRQIQDKALGKLRSFPKLGNYCTFSAPSV